MPEFSGLAKVRTNKIWVELFSADIWSKTNLYAAATPYPYYLDGCVLGNGTCALNCMVHALDTNIS